MQKRIPFPLPATALKALDADTSRFAAIDRFVPLRITVGGDGVLQSAVAGAWRSYLERHDKAGDRRTVRLEGLAKERPQSSSRPDDDVAGALAASDFGLIFKERTRIEPIGFALGEHLLSLSLAPGEEVTIEQKAFSERTVTLEETTESDNELNMEASSTLSTEMSTQLQRQLSETKQNNFELGVNAGGNYKGAEVTVSPRWSNSLTQADSTTRTEAVRTSASESQKVAAKCRTQHKITMKVSETSRFESTSKRVIRNPNPNTPIDLVYFKVMQRLRLSQERYGVRLCWAPFIPDPGAITEAARQQARRYYEDLYPLDLPPEPQRPIEPARAAQYGDLGWQELKEWGFWGDMQHEYEFDIGAPGNYQWDGDESAVAASVQVRTQTWGKRSTPNVYVMAASSNGSGGVHLRIHGGADCGGPGAHLYVNCSARFVVATNAPPDPAYVQQLQTWETAHADWARQRDEALAARSTKVEEAFATWSTDFWRSFDPASAAMQLMVSNLFPATMRDESWEVDAWTTFFEFENGALRLYPGWWSDRPPRDPHAGPNSFQNASWARVFLPVRPGYEREALAWLVERRLFTSGGGAVTGAVDDFIKQLEEYRSKNFGGTEEVEIGKPNGNCPSLQTPFICLGTWEETLPTDGTHLEVLQANTTAMDDPSEQAFASSQQLLRRRSDLLASQGGLTDGVTQQVSATAPTLDVVVNVGRDDQAG